MMHGHTNIKFKSSDYAACLEKYSQFPSNLIHKMKFYECFFHTLLHANTGHLRFKGLRGSKFLEQLSNGQLLKRDALSLSVYAVSYL
jgi:membrane associated rhomboid family serine protease